MPIPKPSLEIDKVGEEILQALKVRNIRVQYDKDERNRPGFKFAEYELKGVPIRIGIGARDLEKGVVEIARRDTKEKELVEVEKVADYVQDLLKTIQQNLFDRAKAFRETNTHFVDTWDEFQKTLEEKGGFIYAHWDGNSETEELIKEKTKATIRCIPLDAVEESGKCILTGRPSQRRVLFAKAY